MAKTASVQKAVNFQRLVAELSHLIFRPLARSNLAQLTIRQAQAAWRNLVAVQRTYPDTDAVKVGSGRQVLVFNIRRNDYRLIVAAHFNRQLVYALRFMTHAECSKDRWKDTL